MRQKASNGKRLVREDLALCWVIMAEWDRAGHTRTLSVSIGKKFKTELPYDTVIPILRIYIKES